MARVKASRARRAVLVAGLASSLAAGAVAGFSVAGANTESVGEPTASEKIVIDGVDVYRTEPPNGGPAVYGFEPPSEADIAAIEDTPAAFDGSDGWLTTGDLEACKFLVARPGTVVKGCALVLAQEQNGDLDLTDGPPQLVYSACGREPNPGEVEDCGGVVIDEAQVDAALEELRTALEAERGSYG